MGVERIALKDKQMTFDQALEQLGNRNRRKVNNNTHLERTDNDTVGVVLHGTCVVKFNRNGSVILNAGGWQTKTTMRRINDYSPMRVKQRDFAWYLTDGREFENGIDVGTQAASLFDAA